MELSLDGATEETHDAVRGSGSFKKVILAARNMKKQGMEFTFRMTLNKLNYKETKSFIALSASLGAVETGFRKTISTEHNTDNKDLFGMPPETYRKLLSEIPSLEEKYGIGIFSGDPLAIIVNKKIMKKISKLGFNNVFCGCSLGVSYLFISCDGKLKPCPMVDIEIGDLTKQNLWDLWEKSEFFRKIRERDIEGCKECKFKFICGGCRAAAFATTGDYFGKDPSCWLIS